VGESKWERRSRRRGNGDFGDRAEEGIALTGKKFYLIYKQLLSQDIGGKREIKERKENSLYLK